MPYCWKCGAELDEDAKFCHRCGASVSPPATMPEERRMKTRVRRPFGVLAIALIAILVAAMLFIALIFIPARSVSASETRDVPYQTGVENLNLDLTANLASVNVTFERLVGKLVSLNVSAVGRVGVLPTPSLFNLTFDYAIVGDTLTVASHINTAYGWPWQFSVRITCDLRIDPSMNVNLSAKTSVGEINLNTKSGVVFDSLDLEAVTGAVGVDLVDDVVVRGNVSLKTTTGGVALSWKNVVVTRNIEVDLRTTTGGVSVNTTQVHAVAGDVTLKAETTTGGVAYSIEIRDNVGAEIASTTSFGGIDVDRQVGFSGTKSLLQSSNYPAGSNFNASLRTTTGGITVAAKYTP